VYTVLFYWLDPDAGKLASWIVSRAKHCWWAARLSKAILQSEVVTTPAVPLGRLFGEKEKPATKVATLDQRFVWSPPLDARNVLIKRSVRSTTADGRFRSNFQLVPASPPQSPMMNLGSWKEINAA